MERTSLKKYKQITFIFPKRRCVLPMKVFDNYRFEHIALPEMDFSEIDA